MGDTASIMARYGTRLAMAGTGTAPLVPMAAALAPAQSGRDGFLAPFTTGALKF